MIRSLNEQRENYFNYDDFIKEVEKVTKLFINLSKKIDKQFIPEMYDDKKKNGGYITLKHFSYNNDEIYEASMQILDIKYQDPSYETKYKTDAKNAMEFLISENLSSHLDILSSEKVLGGIHCHLLGLFIGFAGREKYENEAIIVYSLRKFLPPETWNGFCWKILQQSQNPFLINNLKQKILQKI